MQDHQTRLVLLGSFRIVNPPRIPAAPLTLKHKAILSYLAAHPNKTVRRDFLCQLVWPDSTLNKARHSLSQALYAISGTLPGWVSPGSKTATFVGPTESVDIFSAGQVAKEGKIHHRRKRRL
jgi:DNA-binding SARP family transcriptional activator